MSDYHSRQRDDRARYLHDTRNHRMTIRQNDGLYRHITMRAPGTSAYHFNVVTFPGYLVFAGDMGSYTFSRLRDMFEFHRIDWGDETPTIDYRYWAQKAEALDKHGGETEFDESAFKQAAIREFWNHNWPDHETRREEWTSWIRDIIGAGHQTSQEATRAMMEFEYCRVEEAPYVDKLYYTRPFADFYECGSFTKPSFHLKWACWAIAETIRAYDLGGDRFARQDAHDKLVLEGAL